MFEEIKNPGSQYRGAPFWAWNGKLEEKELRWQIRVMKEMGLGGFFMHSRVGLDTPYLSREWFNCINACADEAEKQKMLAFLYDEDRWPSGAAGGLVTKDRKYRMRHLFMKILDDGKNLDEIKNVKRIFVAEFEGPFLKSYRKIEGKKELKCKPDEKILVFSVEIQKESEWYNGYTYLDTLNPEAVKKFIKITHRNYKKYSGKYFGKIIPGIFTDEPNYGRIFFEEQDKIGISWTDKLLEVFRERYRYNILDFLPEIYFNRHGEKISKVRYHYFDCITYLFVDSFAKQIGNWCERNNLLFTGHILAEDTLSSQTHVVGSCMRFYQYMQAPGMDLLTEYWRMFNTAKQVSSIANQFGRKWRLTETYGCTGWDFPFAGHKALGDWQIALGINLRCQHLSWYTMLGEAKRDYPASIFYQSPWWSIYKKVEDYFARVISMMSRGKEVRDLLVIHPIESMWAIYRKENLLERKVEYAEEVVEYDKMFVRLCDKFLSLHIDFDYGDEEILAKYGKVKKGSAPKFVVNKAEYRAIVVPPLYTIRSSTLKLLENFLKAGGQVVFVEKYPEYIDGEKKDYDYSRFTLCKDLEAAIEKIEGRTRRISIHDENGKEISPVLYLLREDNNFYYLFVCNTSMPWNEDLSKSPPVRERKIEFKEVIIRGFPPFKNIPYEFNPETGYFYLAETEKEKDGYVIKTDLPPIASRIFLIPKRKISIKTEKRKKLLEKEFVEIKREKWEIKLSEDNVLVLDMPFYKIGDGKWNEKQEILKVDRKVREYLGLKPRGGSMVQPWARKKKNPISAKVYLMYEFEIEKIPSGEISLCIEKPELYEIFINQHRIFHEMDKGWWVDKSLRRISIDPAFLKTGKNQILLATDYDENHPGFEIIYLTGKFAVKIEENKLPRLSEFPNKIEIGDWTEKGFPFYAGNLTYITEVKLEKKEGSVFLRIPEYSGVALRIFIDGQQVGIIAWPPNEIEITNFIKNKTKFILGIEVMGHRRNSHGPLHWIEKWPIWTGPYQFIPEGDEFYKGYQIVPCGLMELPQIVFYEEK